MSEATFNKTVEVNLGDRTYPIRIGQSVLEEAGPMMRERCQAERVLVVTNTTVGPLYGERVLASLRGAGFEADIIELPDGEKYKNLETLNSIFDFLMERGYPRRSALLALGGGVVGDITGYAAASYMRGVEYVQVPTSLLAMVDSSVGGKTGVNHPLGKNMIGAFYQPRFVLIDIGVLDTLDKAEFRAGFAEVIKYSIIWDGELFDFLNERLAEIYDLQDRSLVEMIGRCCEIKARVVEEDERESGLRAILNYGHTIGHAIEAGANYEGIKHGEGVAIGMVAASRIAVEMGLLKDAHAEAVWQFINKAKLPYRQTLGLETNDIYKLMFKDKKVQAGKLRFVLPVKIGKVVIRDDVPGDLVQRIIEELKA